MNIRIIKLTLSILIIKKDKNKKITMKILFQKFMKTKFKQKNSRFNDFKH